MIALSGRSIYFMLVLMQYAETRISDKEFFDYVTGLDVYYQESGTKPPDYSKAVTGRLEFRSSWHFTGFGEVPYIMIYYSKLLDKNKESYVPGTPGYWCGGLRLTVMRLITSCRCLNTWYHDKIGQPATYRPEDVEPYDMKAKRIFATTLKDNVVFEPDDLYELDTSDLGQCGIGKSLKVEALVVKFKPTDPFLWEAPKFDLTELAPWPPRPLSQVEPNEQYHDNIKTSTNSTLTSYGFNLYKKHGKDFEIKTIQNEFGDDIQVNSTSVNVELRKIKVQGECMEQLDFAWNLKDDARRKEQTGNYSVICFKSNQETNYIEICGGAPGFPVHTDGTIHGIVIEPLDCDRGIVATFAFNHDLQLKIEDIIDSPLLNVVKPDDAKINIRDDQKVELNDLYHYNYFWDLYGGKHTGVSKSSSHFPYLWVSVLIQLMLQNTCISTL
ncbi:hypothetical protein GE061_019959 [Apolygus lucorum]|uniref:Uncharacterized protein n=1 Tax=Apolygus lucorum TaxID=248454 RepID=A0A8S9XDW6_APOLU|nr:hypothetical protein GE061_019959 [Apolygus lucorum]